MHKIFIALLTVMLSLGLAMGEAQAKRFGGGKSFGEQRQASPQPQAPHAQPAAPAPAAPGMGNRWLGPLAGLAAGGLLASMFMGGGFHGISPMDIFMMVAIAGLVFFGVRAWRRSAARQAPQPMQYAAANGYGGERVITPEIGSGRDARPASVMPPLPAARPDWFNEQEFLRAAKGNFIRLQAAYDAADLNDIREYTTPEVYAEISLQMQERGTAPQHTEVVSMNAELVNFITEHDHVMASVRYSGEIREAAGAPAAPFVEIWNIKRATNEAGAPWYIAGIQQA